MQSRHGRRSHDLARTMKTAAKTIDCHVEHDNEGAITSGTRLYPLFETFFRLAQSRLEVATLIRFTPMRKVIRSENAQGELSISLLSSPPRQRCDSPAFLRALSTPHIKLIISKTRIAQPQRELYLLTAPISFAESHLDTAGAMNSPERTEHLSHGGKKDGYGRRLLEPPHFAV